MQRPVSQCGALAPAYWRWTPNPPSTEQSLTQQWPSRPLCDRSTHVKLNQMHSGARQELRHPPSSSMAVSPSRTPARRPSLSRGRRSTGAGSRLNRSELPTTTSAAGASELEPQNWSLRTGASEREAQSWRLRAGASELEPQNWSLRAGGSELETQSGSLRAGASELEPRSGSLRVRLTTGAACTRPNLRTRGRAAPRARCRRRARACPPRPRAARSRSPTSGRGRAPCR